VKESTGSKDKAPTAAPTSEAESPAEKKLEQDELKREEAQKKLAEERRLLREANLEAASKRPGSAFLKTLISNVQKNASFIKKLRALSEEQKDQICSELLQLNLSRYISEVVAAISEAKLKPTDINAAVKVCSLLHQRYAEFSSLLIPSLTKVFFGPKPTAPESEQERNAKLIKKRVTLRFLTELFLVGVFNDVDVIYKILQELINSDQSQPSKDLIFSHLSLIVGFVKTTGEEFFGLSPKKLQRSSESAETPSEEKELKKDSIVTPQQQKMFSDLINSYFNAVSKFLLSEHKELRAKERENHQILETRGELSEAHTAAYDKIRKSYEKIMNNLSTLAELLNKDMPQLPEDSHTTRIDSGTSLQNSVEKENPQVESIWQDEDTRSFYENLPELRVLVPAVLFGESDPKEKEKEKEAKEAKSKEKEEKEKEKEPEKTKEKEKETKSKEKEAKSKEKEKESEKTKEKDDLQGGGSTLDKLLSRLPNCVNRDLVDQAAIEFCYINSKGARKKLVKSLFNVPRTSLSLIPYYSRLVATLNQCMKVSTNPFSVLCC
jgi:regulator of nonsense transcripts 2